MENPWRTLGGKKVYQNNWIDVEEYDVINPVGNKGIYGVVRPRNHAIAILPLDENNDTWIVGQYRFTTDTYEWELPKGGCLIGIESPLEAGQRELKEETGIVAKSWRQVLSSNLSNCFTDECSFSFVARDLSFGDSQPEQTEVLELKKIKFDELFEMVLQNRINCALSQVTVMTVKILMDQNRL